MISSFSKSVHPCFSGINTWKIELFVKEDTIGGAKHTNGGSLKFNLMESFNIGAFGE